MNGYQFTADTYKTLLEKDQDNHTQKEIEEIKQNIKVFETLATFEDNDKYIAFDSGMFNDIFKGYIELIIKEIEYNGDEKKKAALQLLKADLNRLSSTILDLHSAKNADDEYYGRR